MILGESFQIWLANEHRLTHRRFHQDGIEMQKLITVGSLALLLNIASTWLSAAQAASLCTGFPPVCSNVSVDCGYKLKVTAQNSGGTLTLTPPAKGVPAATVDPIFMHSCPANGITISNPATVASTVNNGLTFTLECNVTNQNLFAAIKGAPATTTATPAGIGITLKGSGLFLNDCIVDGFAHGIVSTGDGNDIESCVVQNSAGDGFVVHDTVSFVSLNFTGDSIGANTNGNVAIHNAGFGFNIVANGLSAATSQSVPFNNIANDNGKGGFLIKGNGNTISGANASGNNGPGIVVTSPSCCTNSGSSPGQDLDAAVVDNNAGPGIIYSAKDDLTNNGLPSGYNGFAGGVFATDDGTKKACPPGAVDPTGTGHEICLIVLGIPCSQKVLNACP
jgi:hypothetical protein